MLAKIWNIRAIVFICVVNTFVLTTPPQIIEYYRHASEVAGVIHSILTHLLVSSLLSASVLVSLLTVQAGPINERPFNESSHSLSVRIMEFLLIISPVIGFWRGYSIASTQQHGASFFLSPYFYVSVFSITFIFIIGLAFFHPRLRAKLESIRSYIPNICLALLIASGTIFIAFTISAFFGGQYVVFIGNKMGSFGIIILFFSTMCIFLANCTILYDRKRIPLLSMIIIWCATLSYFDLNDNHKIRTLQADTKYKHNARLSEQTLIDWLSERPDKDKYKASPYPIFLVSAQGGGIYSAYHTASVLARIQSVWPQFSSHIFGISSVSGGSLGAALFSELSENIGSTKKKDCLNFRQSNLSPVDVYFDFDFLSPLLYMTLFPDLFQRLMPFTIEQFDRARGLEYSIEGAWEKLSVTCGIDTSNPFAASFLDSWNISSTRPALFLNTTEVSTGRPVIVSPLRSTNKSFVTIWDMGFRSDLRLSTAVGVSARFPGITSSGWFNGGRLDWLALINPTTIHLVDGGFYDNSGADLLLNIALTIKQISFFQKLNADVHLIVIGNAEFLADEFILQLADRSDKFPDVANFIRSLLKKNQKHIPLIEKEDNSFYEIGSPMRAMFGARRHRSAEAIKSLIRINEIDPLFEKDPYLTIEEIRKKGLEIRSSEELRRKLLENTSIEDPIMRVLTGSIDEIEGVIRRGRNLDTLSNRKSMSVFNGNRTYLFPLSAYTTGMPLGWLLSRHTKDRLLLRAGNSDDCFFSYRFPPYTNLQAFKKMIDFADSYNEDIRGVLDNWMADCSQRALFDFVQARH